MTETVARRTFLVVTTSLLVAVVIMMHNVYLLQSQVIELQRDVSQSQAMVLKEMGKVRDYSSVMASSQRKTMATIREELEQARKEAAQKAGHEKEEALANVQRLVNELGAEQRRQAQLHEESRQERQELVAALNRADAKVADVNSEVKSVKTEVAQTQHNLSKTVADLRRVIGDMGVMSGLIATNQRELDVLKAVGDRSYTEFRLVKTKEPQVVAGVSLLLKKADPGSRRYTLELTADDQKILKKDRAVNEPVQFYVSQAKAPYELVVNTVTKNEIVGYIASPKSGQGSE